MSEEGVHAQLVGAIHRRYLFENAHTFITHCRARAHDDHLDISAYYLSYQIYHGLQRDAERQA